MGAYLELLEEKNKLGLISESDLGQSAKTYNDISEHAKEKRDEIAKRELIRMKANTSLYLQTLQVKEAMANNSKIGTIKGWVTFFGVLQIISIILLLKFLSEIT